MTVKKVMPNKFSKACSVCRTNVPTKSGFAVLQSGWKTVCSSSVCIASLGDDVQTAITALSTAPIERGYITENGEVYFPFDAQKKDLVKSLPKSRWLRAKKCWSVSTEQRHRAVVLDAVKRCGFDYPSSWDDTAVEISDSHVVEALDRARGTAYDYQLDGIEFLANNPRCLLGDDMGLGKTLQSLFALPKNARAIVICPNSLKLTWASEVAKWRSDLATFVCVGRKGKTAFRLPKRGEVVIVNYEILPTWLDTDKSYKTLSDTQLIVDEAHYTKNHRAKRSQRVKRLSDLCKGAWAMSGTPLMNRPFDLWGVLSTFQLEREVFGGFGGFLRDMNGKKNKWGGYDFGTPKMIVAEQMRRVMLRRRKDEVLTSLPPKRFSDVILPISDVLRRQADEAFKIIRENEDELPHFSDFSELRASLAESRIPHLIELVESYEDSDEPLVVFSDHRQPILTLGARQGWACILGDTPQHVRQEAVEAFQRGDLKGIALTIGAGSTGLTLTRASTMIFCDLSWTPSNNAQAEDRICRIGQTADSLHYVRLLSDCEMDKHVVRLLDRKKLTINTAIDGRIEITETEVAQAPQIVIETEAEQAQRKLEINEQIAREKLAENPLRYSPIEPKVITAERQQIICEAMELMIGWCDDAIERDGSGFSKSDVGLKYIYYSGVLHDINNQEYLAYTDERLRRYHRQLSSVVPQLFES